MRIEVLTHEFTYFENDEEKTLIVNLKYVQINNVIWFIGNDAAREFGYPDAKRAIYTIVSEKNKKSYDCLQKPNYCEEPYIQPKTVFINKYGLNELLMKSKIYKKSMNNIM